MGEGQGFKSRLRRGKRLEMQAAPARRQGQMHGILGGKDVILMKKLFQIGN